jgi:dihydroneopterin aldolase
MRMGKDEIQLSQVKVDGRFGVSDRERAREQTLLVDLALRFDIARAAETEDLAATISYSEVVRAIQGLADEREYRLMETFAAHCAAKVLAAFPVESVVVRVRRPQPASIGQMAFAGVEIERSR